MIIMPSLLPSLSRGRLPARLLHLPPAARRELAARHGCASAGELARLCWTSESVRRDAERFLAERDPLPAWAVSEVLLSINLVPELMELLALEQRAAMAVCKAWYRGWRDTGAARRQLRPATLPEADFELAGSVLAAHPDGERLVVKRDRELRIVGRQMQTLHTHALPWSAGYTAVGHDALFVVRAGMPSVYRFALDGFAQQAVINDEANGMFHNLALAPTGVLFALRYDHSFEVLAFDATSLALRHRFGRSHFDHATGMAVVGDELYVGDYARDCIHAFSFAGELLREIRGDWRALRDICFVNERLYLIEHISGSENSMQGEQYPGEGHPQGKRVLVLTPRGETLQSFSDLPNVRYLFRLTVFDGKLLVKAMLTNHQNHIFALQGL